MQLFVLGLFSVWLLAFGVVHSELPPENVFESEVDVKNLMESYICIYKMSVLSDLVLSLKNSLIFPCGHFSVSPLNLERSSDK